MKYIQLFVPPLPHYINSGTALCHPGEGHSKRKDIDVFDLLVVSKGTLHMEEDGAQWSIQTGQALLLNPKGQHFSYKACTEYTEFFWLHFSAFSEWKEVYNPSFYQTNSFNRTVKRLNEFTIHIPKFQTLTSPERTFSSLQNLILLMEQQCEVARLKEQSLFQEILRDFYDKEESIPKSSSGIIAEKTTTFIHEHYWEDINYDTLSRSLQYNSTYISRCMKKVFQCTPLEYLKNYRMEKAKLLLINTDFSISSIAEKVGFNNFSYFIKCFTEYEKITPKLFREKYRILTTNRWDLSE